MSRIQNFRNWLGHGPARFDQLGNRSVDMVDNPRASTILLTATTDVEHRHGPIVAERLRERPRDVAPVPPALATWECEGGRLGQPELQRLPGSVERTTAEPRHEGLRDLPNKPARAMVVLGGCCVVLGGLVAAVTTPLTLDKGSWLAAYLVLVCGVAQFAIGSVQTRFSAQHLSAARSWTQLTCWNLGNVAVLAGTLAGAARVLDAGASLLLIALGITLVSWLQTGPMDREAVERAAREPVPAFFDWAYGGLLVLLLISIPIGVLLAHLHEAT